MRNFICAQVLETNFLLIRVDPINFDRENHLGFKKLFNKVGVMIDMITCGAKYQIEGESRKIL